MHSVTLRPFADTDYPAMVMIHNAIFPDYLESEAEWRHWDGSRPDHCLCERLIAERDGAAVGYGHIVQWPGMYHPQKFAIDVKVLPEQQHQGIGAQIYAALYERLLAHGAVAVRTEVREDMGVCMAFARQRGFVEEMRTWESRLAVAPFDPAPFADHRIKGAAEIVTLAELITHDPDYRPKLHGALMEMLTDVPRPDVFTPIPFADWEKSYFTDTNLYPEAYFLAMVDGEIAAVSQLWRSDWPDVLYTGLTATRRDFRRMGLALALKLRAIAFAKDHSIRELRTGNASTNRAMLSINEALGFVKQPAWISLRADIAR